MGRVRTKTVKRAARQIVERYYDKLSGDFELNKKVTREAADIQSKRLRNKVAGFATHLVKRLKSGPVRGVTLKMQAEEMEKQLDDAPTHTAYKIDYITVDRDIYDLLQTMDLSFNNVHVPK